MKIPASRPQGGFFFALILTLLAGLVTPAPAATLLPNGKQQFVDQNGAPLASGSVQFYVPNSTTPKNTWQDAGQVILNTNPIALDIAGRATIYGAGCYRQVVKDKNGNTIWDQPTCDTSALSILWGGRSTGTANTQIVTASNFTSTDGQTVAFIAGATNTGPTSLVVNGGANINILKDTQTGSFSLAGNELVAGNLVQAVYDATRGAFHLLTSGSFVGANPLSSISGSGTTDLGSLPSQFVNILGSATITALGSSASTNFPFYTVTFAGVTTLVNSASLILPSGQNIVTVAGDTSIFVYQGAGVWKLTSYNRSVANTAPGNFTGLRVANNTTTPNTKIDVSATSADINSAFGANVRFTPVAQTIDLNTVGANGLDTGSISASSWYNIYLISNGTTVSALASLSATAPTLPSGYVYFSRVGAMRTNASSILLRITQRGRESRYTVTSGSSTAVLPVMGSGPAGNSSALAPTDWVAISTANFAPPTAQLLIGVGSVSNAALIVAPNNNYFGFQFTNQPPLALQSTTNLSVTFSVVLESMSIYFAANSGNAFVSAYGWQDSINAN